MLYCTFHTCLGRHSLRHPPHTPSTALYAKLSAHAQDGILFDNILISHDPEAASVAAKIYEARKEKEDELLKRDVSDIERQPGFAGSVAYYAALALRFVKTNPIPVRAHSRGGRQVGRGAIGWCWA